MKNNVMEAVIMSFEHYEKLTELEEFDEHKEIYSIVEERMKHYDVSKDVSWASLRNK